MSDTTVIALGGNALVQPDQSGQFDEQIQSATETADCIAAIVESGKQVILTHGNGPQVGNILLQNDCEADAAQRMPLFACSAESQGLIGSALAIALNRAFQRRNIDRRAVPVLTPVDVNSTDNIEPSKPVGPFYTESEAKQLESKTGHAFVEDAGRGWRRVVPSPEPETIHGTEHISSIAASGDVPIAAGGGGLPITASNTDQIEYVDGVVDKDIAAAQLGIQLECDQLIILTDVSHVLLEYGTPDERPITEVDVETARQYQQEGHFKRGSMYEKVEAACRFIESGVGSRATITSLSECEQALDGTVGTNVVSTDTQQVVQQPSQQHE